MAKTRDRVPENKKIILFDGVCNLCNDVVKLVIKNDKKDIFRFASLQSEVGKTLTIQRGINSEEMNSVVLIEPGVAYYESSSAVLEISKHLSGGYSFIQYFSFFPESLRDGIYNFIASNRYKWFGKKEACMIPTPDLQAKFLE